jgi:hypothetical protein
VAQYGLPDADHANDAQWIQGAGDGDGDHFDELDEGIDGGSPDDSTTYWITSGLDGTARRIRCKIDEPTDPGGNSGYYGRIRVAKDVVDGKTIQIGVDVYNTWTLRWNGVSSNFNNTSYTDFDDQASGAEADALTFTDIVVSASAIEGGAGAERELACTAVEFECPSVAGGPASLRLLVGVGG